MSFFGKSKQASQTVTESSEFDPWKYILSEAPPTGEEVQSIKQWLKQNISQADIKDGNTSRLTDLLSDLDSGVPFSYMVRRYEISLGYGSPSNKSLIMMYMSSLDGDAIACAWIAQQILCQNGFSNEIKIEAAKRYASKLKLNGDMDASTISRVIYKSSIGKDYDFKSGYGTMESICETMSRGIAKFGQTNWIEETEKTLTSVRRELPGHIDDDADTSESAVTADAPHSGISFLVASYMPDNVGRFAVLGNELSVIGIDDPSLVFEELLAEFPWAQEPIAAWRNQLIFRTLSQSPEFRLRPFLLLGPPGVGKSRLIRRLSEVCKVPHHRFNASGHSGAIEVIGSSRIYRNPRPSLPSIAIAKSRVANPVLFIDEVEKFGTSDQWGDPIEALLPLLETETSSRFPDIYLETELNLSKVTYGFSANDTSSLPKPFIDRVQIFNIPPPGKEHFDLILTSMINSIAEDYNVSVEMIPILTELDTHKLKKDMEFSGSIRDLRAKVEGVIGQKITNLVNSSKRTA